MTYKHVDLIAIGILLLTIAFFARVRSAVAYEFDAPRRVFSHKPYGPVIVVPRPPRVPVPSISFSRD